MESCLIASHNTTSITSHCIKLLNQYQRNTVFIVDHPKPEGGEIHYEEHRGGYHIVNTPSKVLRFTVEPNADGFRSTTLGIVTMWQSCSSAKEGPSDKCEQKTSGCAYHVTEWMVQSKEKVRNVQDTQIARQCGGITGMSRHSCLTKCTTCEIPSESRHCKDLMQMRLKEQLDATWRN